MKLTINSIGSLLCAGAAILLCAGCAAERPVDARFCMEPNQKVIETIIGKTAPADLKPGKIYIDQELAKIFTVRMMDLIINEEGMPMARVYGKTDPETFWQYALKGEYGYRIHYRFFWFDAAGKLLKNDKKVIVDIREALPGDPVRFVALASDENAKKFCFCAAFEPEKKKEDAKKADNTKKDAAKADNTKKDAAKADNTKKDAAKADNTKKAK